MKCSDGNTVTKHQLVYFQDGVVKVWSSLLEGGYSSVREIDLLNTLKALLEVTQNLYEENRGLRDENAELNRRPKRPKLKPSKIATEDKAYQKKRDSRQIVKNPDKSNIPVTKTIRLKADTVPKGSRFKGYQHFHVQDIEIITHNTLYERERWQSPDGKMIVAPLPDDINEMHFGPKLRQFILYQYYHQRVTQPLLLNQLRELGISISAGQLSNLLTKNHQQWHKEKADILSKGLAHSSYIQVDDTGAKHHNKNHYCTQVCNDAFSIFETRQTKSRINFLEILQGEDTGYALKHQTTLQHLSKKEQFTFYNNYFFQKATDIDYYSNKDDWNNMLITSYISRSNYQTFTEAAMLGYLNYKERLNPDLIVLSDNAGQFKIGNNAACWVHAERILTAIIARDEHLKSLKEYKLKQFWLLYRYIDVKRNKATRYPHIRRRAEWLFDHLCEPPETKSAIAKPLKNLKKMKTELLLCVDNPNIPMHNNQCESDIRDYVIKRNISGSTRSYEGLQSRDTFLSLKKTARKQGVSFWYYLGDRLTNQSTSPSLSELVEKSLTN
jgi:hypothetical protein